MTDETDESFNDYVDKKKQKHKPLPPISEDTSTEKILAFIGIKNAGVRHDAYTHWERFIQFIKDRAPADWKDDLRPKLRSYIGVDFRYIDDYLKCCISWEIMKLNNGTVEFIGIPEQKGQKGKGDEKRS